MGCERRPASQAKQKRAGAGERDETRKRANANTRWRNTTEGAHKPTAASDARGAAECDDFPRASPLVRP